MSASVSVASDQVARLYRSGGGTVYRPRLHRPVECAWIQTARRHTRRPGLFLYRHARTGSYMLACWVVRPNEGRGPGLFVELEDLDGHPDQLGPGSARRISMRYLRARLRPARQMFREIEEAWARQAYEEDAAQEESDRERMDVARWIGRRPGLRWERIAMGIRTGELPFVGERQGGEALRELTETLCGMRAD